MRGQCLFLAARKFIATQVYHRYQIIIEVFASFLLKFLREQAFGQLFPESTATICERSHAQQT